VLVLRNGKGRCTSLSLSVPATVPVSDLKMWIIELLGVVPETITLMCNGEPMNQDYIFMPCAIESGQQVHAIVDFADFPQHDSMCLEHEAVASQRFSPFKGFHEAYTTDGTSSSSNEMPLGLQTDFANISMSKLRELAMRVASKPCQTSAPGTATSETLRVSVFIFASPKRLHCDLEIEATVPQTTVAEIKQMVLDELETFADIELMIPCQPGVELANTLTLGECGCPKEVCAIVCLEEACLAPGKFQVRS